jgi:16S rRNA (cytosine1402-N4)-methyltransferase
MSAPDTHHIPVLFAEVMDFFQRSLSHYSASFDNSIWIDCTLGGAGHTRGLLELIEAQPAKVVLHSVDQDETAIKRGNELLHLAIKKGQVVLHRGRMSEVLPELMKTHRVTGLFGDFGISSDQLDSTERGFGFRQDAPLDMRMDPSRGRPLSEMLTVWTENEIERFLSEYGEERYARRIARNLADLRKEDRIPTTTAELAYLIRGAYPKHERHARLDPATRSFQAFRIAVNDELSEIEAWSKTALKLSVPGALAVAISFHSLEDRIIKNAFRSSENFEILTKKPITATETEFNRNSRSRSAKLRAAQVRALTP